jgi:aromatic-L-amino-acid/L-tryptophan decarboxylase
MDLQDLQHQIAADRGRGDSAFLVVATVGTTASGAIDPLEQIAAICRQEGLWLHADAAWGGIAALSDRHAGHVAGLALADSLTCDAHKILPVPTGVAMFFCRDGSSLRRVFDVHPGYVPEADDGSAAAYQYSLQWSRRAMGLKVFMTLAELGTLGVQAMIDRQFAMAERLREALRVSGWHVVNDSALPLVCFVDPQGADAETIAKAVVEEGQVWLSTVTTPSGTNWLRACITHHDVRGSDVVALLDALQRARVQVASPRQPTTGAADGQVLSQRAPIRSATPRSDRSASPAAPAPAAPPSRRRP